LLQNGLPEAACQCHVSCLLVIASQQRRWSRLAALRWRCHLPRLILGPQRLRRGAAAESSSAVLPHLVPSSAQPSLAWLVRRHVVFHRLSLCTHHDPGVPWRGVSARETRLIGTLWVQLSLPTILIPNAYTRERSAPWVA